MKRNVTTLNRSSNSETQFLSAYCQAIPVLLIAIGQQGPPTASPLFTAVCRNIMWSWANLTTEMGFVGPWSPKVLQGLVIRQSKLFLHTGRHAVLWKWYGWQALPLALQHSHQDMITFLESLWVHWELTACQTLIAAWSLLFYREKKMGLLTIAYIITTLFTHLSMKETWHSEGAVPAKNLSGFKERVKSNINTTLVLGLSFT